MNAEIIYRIEESYARDNWLAEIASDTPNAPEDPQAGSDYESEAWRAALQMKPQDMSFDAFAKIMEESMERATRHAMRETIAKLKEAHDHRQPSREDAD